MSNQHMSGRDVAVKVGVHDSAVSRWRRGLGAPNMEAMAALANMFNVEPLSLAVLAGLVSEKVAGVPPAPMPEPVAQREEVRARLLDMPGLTMDERQSLLERYDELQRGTT